MAEEYRLTFGGRILFGEEFKAQASSVGSNPEALSIWCCICWGKSQGVSEAMQNATFPHSNSWAIDTANFHLSSSSMTEA